MTPDLSADAILTAPELLCGDSLSVWLEKIRRAWRQPGVAICIVDGEHDIRAAAGALRMDDAARVDDQTLFAAASISKTFAAASIAVLVDRGVLTFDDKVKNHLPDFLLSDPRATSEATIRDLLSNRIGLESSEGRHRRCATSRKDLLVRMRRQRFRHPFRKGYGYCSDGFTVIGAIVEAATRITWEQFAEEEIWSPLGMFRTNADHIRAKADRNAASPHLWDGDSFSEIDWAYEEAATPAGGVNTCAADLSIWLRALLGRGAVAGQRLISSEQIEHMLMPHTAEEGPFKDEDFACVLGHGPLGVKNQTYALGWYRHEYRGTSICYHTGSIDGFRSIIGFLPESDFGVAVLANADNPFLPRAIFQALLDQHLNLEGGRWLDAFLEHQQCAHTRPHIARLDAHASKTVDSACLERHCGAYFDDTGFGESDVYVDNGHLVLRAGSAEFDICQEEGGAIAGYRRPPYARLRQFSGVWEYDNSGEAVRLLTDQGACFVKQKSAKSGAIL